MSGERFLRPGAQLGLRDDAFAAAMRRAEQKANPTPQSDPRDPIGRTSAGLVVRRNGEHFVPGPFLDLESLPLVP